jgi:hypothetical protein
MVQRFGERCFGVGNDLDRVSVSRVQLLSLSSLRKSLEQPRRLFVSLRRMRICCESPLFSLPATPLFLAAASLSRLGVPLCPLAPSAWPSTHWHASKGADRLAGIVL